MPITAPPAPLSRLSLFRGFLEVFLLLFLVLAFVGFMHYYTFYTTERSAREAGELLNVDLAKWTLASDITGVVGDLMFLAENIERQGLFEVSIQERERRISRSNSK